MPTLGKDVQTFLNNEWEVNVIPALSEFIKIPNQTPVCDPDWMTNGLQEKAMDLILEWVEKQGIRGLRMELLQESEQTPLLFIQVEPTPKTSHDRSVLMYGHMDKQPPLRPWGEGLDPTIPVRRGNKLYGRGATDDGYAIFAAVMSIRALQHFGHPHGRINIILEGAEESGSPGLMLYMEKLKARLGNVDLIICLDSGALSYDTHWITTSLRGFCVVDLTVELMSEAIHSGIGGGIVADTFRVVRQLLDRVEDAETGEVKLPELHCEIPSEVQSSLNALNKLSSEEFLAGYPLLEGVKPCHSDNAQLASANWWEPNVTYTGIDGIPAIENAGNVLRVKTSMRLSIRLPPLVDASKAKAAVIKTLTDHPPYNARVTATGGSENGWIAPALEPWLRDSLQRGSREAFGADFGSIGLGGSIPFMGQLSHIFPLSQFIVTGVGGPNCNAHGPNEFLHLDFVKKLNCCVAQILTDYVKLFPHL